jgi:hypothetical protein
MPQLSLFDDMRETQRRKYNEVLATGKAVVVLSVARTIKQPFRRQRRIHHQLHATVERRGIWGD